MHKILILKDNTLSSKCDSKLKMMRMNSKMMTRARMDLETTMSQ